MSQWLTAYRVARSRGLEALQNPPGPTRDGAEFPAAAERGVHSFYADTHATAGAVRVCQGTSCVLAGARETLAALERSHSCRTAYCLGYCDQSPVVLTPDSRPITRVHPGNAKERLAEADAALEVPDIRAACKDPIVVERIARGDHSALGAARGAAVYDGLRITLGSSPPSVVQALVDSGERGRGGAAFPTGLKWRRCAEAGAPRKYVVANGDEGDPGSFIDRVLMEFDPHTILEGMAIAAYAVGASEGIVFIRSEYPRAAEVMRGAIEEAVAANLLGADILGRGFDFHVHVFSAMGSYVCGEETAMLNAIEGLRGEVRLRPPYPVVEGLYGMPTVVDNVETLANVPWIMRHGPGAYRARGTKDSAGTKAICLNHGFKRPGIVEVEFGTTLRTVIDDYAQGAAANQRIEALIMGGPMGSIVGPEAWDAPICYTEMASRGLTLGHGGLVAVPAGTDWAQLLEHWLEFMAHESCGKCVPCRLGSKRAHTLAKSGISDSNRDTLLTLFGLMEDASLCAFGREMPGPMREILNRVSSSSTA